MFPPLYVILDEDLLQSPAEECVEPLVTAGVGLIQYRAKHKTPREYLKSCKALATHLTANNIRFIVNDRPDIAAIAGAGGVHVGQDDILPDEARRICGPSLWVGVSTHNLEQVRVANLTAAKYVAIGPIFATSTKESPDPVVGSDFISEARKLTRKPLVAIGGITLARVALCYEAGADCVAIARDILSAPDPAGRAKEFLVVAKTSLQSSRGRSSPHC